MGHLEEKSDTTAIIQFGANFTEDEDKKDGKQRKASGVQQQPTAFLCYDLQSISPAIQVEIQ